MTARTAPPNLQWKPDYSAFLDPATGQWVPANLYGETFPGGNSQASPTGQTPTMPAVGVGGTPTFGSGGRMPGAGNRYESMPQNPGMQDGSGFRDTVKAVGKWALDHGDLIVAGYDAYRGYQDDKRSREMINAAIEAQKERQRMGAAAADRIGGLQRQDLSHIYRDASNPYAKIPAVGSLVGGGSGVGGPHQQPKKAPRPDERRRGLGR